MDDFSRKYIFLFIMLTKNILSLDQIIL